MALKVVILIFFSFITTPYVFGENEKNEAEGDVWKRTRPMHHLEKRSTFKIHENGSAYDIDSDSPNRIVYRHQQQNSGRPISDTDGPNQDERVDKELQDQLASKILSCCSQLSFRKYKCELSPHDDHGLTLRIRVIAGQCQQSTPPYGQEFIIREIDIPYEVPSGMQVVNRRNVFIELTKCIDEGFEYLKMKEVQRFEDSYDPPLSYEKMCFEDI